MPDPATAFDSTSSHVRKRRVGFFVTSIMLACLLAGCGGGGGSASPPPATAPVEVTLDVGVSGSGSVASSPAGIDCNSTCTALFVQGSTVTLTATPGSGYLFSGWGGACASAGTVPMCAVTMSQNQSVTAIFSTQPECVAVVGGRLVVAGTSTRFIPQGFNTNGILYPVSYAATLCPWPPL